MCPFQPLTIIYKFFRVIRGGNFLVDGPANPDALPAIMEKVKQNEFGNKKQDVSPANRRVGGGTLI